MIPWRGPAENGNGQPTFTSYSFYDVFYSQQQIIEGQKPGIDPALFKDRIVIVGAHRRRLEGHLHHAVPARRDQRPRGAREHRRCVSVATARSSRAPAWVDVRARDRRGRCDRRRCRRVPERVADGRGGRAAPRRCSSWQSVALFARGTWIPITVPMLALVFAFVGDLAWKYFVEGREKRQVKKLFSRYVSKDVYDQLVANPSLAALGGARRHMTVLFSDIRGFTTMSEKGTPEDVVGQLNRAVHAHGRRRVRASRHRRQVRRRHDHGALRRAARRRGSRRARGADGAGDDHDAATR